MFIVHPNPLWNQDAVEIVTQDRLEHAYLLDLDLR